MAGGAISEAGAAVIRVAREGLTKKGTFESKPKEVREGARWYLGALHSRQKDP